MQPRAMDFVVYGVSSLDKALPFYRETLGLRPIGDPYQGAWQEFDLAGVTLAIAAPPLAQPPQPGYGGGATVAIAVPDIYEAIEEVRKEGVPVLVEPFETAVCFDAVIADPDGNRILLHQRKDGTAG